MMQIIPDLNTGYTNSATENLVGFKMKFLVTGGAGFVGSAVVRMIINQTDHEVLNFDALTYAGDLSTVASVSNDSRYQFVHGDITDIALVTQSIESFKPDVVMHLAAESHVDRSIDGPSAFINTNIFGTYALLEACRSYWQNLDAAAKDRFRFHHVSTDEVFGSLGPEGLFTEDSPYSPNSPYSASKASSDHLVRSWYHTYGLPCVMSNCSNNYGPYQFPEKLIPLMILNGVNEELLPIYGKGTNIRDWLYVDDHACGLLSVATKADPGASYNIGGNEERTNLEVVQSICAILDSEHPRSGGAPHADLMINVADRPGHDMRYAIDATRIKNDLGWQPSLTFEDGLKQTVLWYLENDDWRTSVDAKNNI